MQLGVEIASASLRRSQLNNLSNPGAPARTYTQVLGTNKIITLSGHTNAMVNISAATLLTKGVPATAYAIEVHGIPSVATEQAGVATVDGFAGQQWVGVGTATVAVQPGANMIALMDGNVGTVAYNVIV